MTFIAWCVFAGVERGVQRVPEFFRQNLDNGFIVQNIHPKLAEKEGGPAFRPMGAESCHCAQVAGIVHGHQLWLKRARCKRFTQLGESFCPIGGWRRCVGRESLENFLVRCTLKVTSDVLYGLTLCLQERGRGRLRNIVEGRSQNLVRCIPCGCIKHEALLKGQKIGALFQLELRLRV